jgi:dinuclear metal center YbgI/SA1388 family protein
MQAADLVGWLDDYLGIEGFPDYKGAVNGLQVQTGRDIRHVATAVDACVYTIEEAARIEADLLLVHHGLFWGRTFPITGSYHRRLSTLLQKDIGLYSSHLPLDAHPEVGNNHVLARMLGLEISGLWGRFEGVSLGVWSDTDLSRDELCSRTEAALGVQALLLKTGPQRISRVAVVTGGGGSMIAEAVAVGADILITGEGAHHTYFEAEEQHINVLYAGHYATETVGVRALGDLLHQRFGLQHTFIHHPTGL